ncbi:MAG TPA: cell division protein FtsZ [Hyphomonadaceae bacterium]|jgi:cell division protein FtsZ|nr:cell division protein FtsZ [Hyphomonadaceae bacterium]
MAVELKPRIVVIGVGGAGGNAVNNMIEANLQGVEFVVANTDAQALVRSKAPTQIQLGIGKTAGLGAGANPEVGMEAAKESSEEIKRLLQGCHMCFIAAGMGGGTGTGAAPIIARIAKEQKVLTVGVVTKPFDFEGKRRMQVAEKGIVDLRSEVDTLLIIPNQNLFRIANKDTTFAEAFGMADKVLYSGVRGITDLMVMPGLINLDFADVRTVMAGMGSAMMGEGEGEGENRALKAAKAAIANPLLDDVSMKGAKGVLINITGGYDMTLFEVDEAANEVRREVDVDAHIILGSTFDEKMAGRIRVSVVAAGLQPVASQAAPRPAPHAMREQIAGGLSASTLNAPSPANELGLHTAAPAPTYAPQPNYAPQPAPQAYAPQPPVHQPSFEPPPQKSVITAPPADRPAGPVIRPRPTPQYEPQPEPQPELLLRNPEPPMAPAPQPAAEPQKEGGRSFASLFGWKSKQAEEPIITTQSPAKPAQDDAFDDELEIPAFLRRSGNA